MLEIGLFGACRVLRATMEKLDLFRRHMRWCRGSAAALAPGIDISSAARWWHFDFRDGKMEWLQPPLRAYLDFTVYL